MSAKVDVDKSSKARNEGNTSFKKGRWVEAIGHYTTAIVFHPSDPVAYNNRAAAYLKLDKFADAERDCTSCIDRSKEINVKAYYRRGLARRGLAKLNEALTDIQIILKADKSNGTAQAELVEIEDLIKQENAKAKAKAKSRGTLPPSPPRTSATIEEIADDEPLILEEANESPAIGRDSAGRVNTATIAPIHSKTQVADKPSKLDLDIADTSSPNGAGPSSFASLRKNRDSRKTYISASTAAPQVIKADSSTATPVSSSAAPSAAVPQAQPPDAPAAASPQNAPLSSATQPSTNGSTHHEPSIPAPPPDPSSTAPGSGLPLVRQLSTLQPSQSWAFLRYYPPEVIPKILGNIITPDILGQLFTVLNYGLSHPPSDSLQDLESEKERVRTIFTGLKLIPRWKTNVFMLNRQEKEQGQQAWALSGAQGSWP